MNYAKSLRICERCYRPICICENLSACKIKLENMKIIVLQHHREAKNTVNSSVTLLCAALDDDSCQIFVGDYFEESIISSILRQENLIFLYPSDESLEDYVVYKEVPPFTTLLVVDGL